jgi:hypothetical protein
MRTSQTSPTLSESFERKPHYRLQHESPRVIRGIVSAGPSIDRTSQDLDVTMPAAFDGDGLHITVLLRQPLSELALPVAWAGWRKHRPALDIHEARPGPSNEPGGTLDTVHRHPAAHVHAVRQQFSGNPRSGGGSGRVAHHNDRTCRQTGREACGHDRQVTGVVDSVPPVGGRKRGAHRGDASGVEARRQNPKVTRRSSETVQQHSRAQSGNVRRRSRRCCGHETSIGKGG